MAYDEELAERIRELVQDEPGLSEKKMFGGLAFLINGNMAVAASGQGGMMLRVDPAETGSLLDEPSVRRVVMRGREMAGWLRIDPAAAAADATFEAWVRRGVDYAASLPGKPGSSGPGPGRGRPA
ncbi:MAG TPA: TfoX/Sxy family protein [Jatrophihabitans sp.]|nr:TfoX/Sxy family protein [Jatrophihabitans sp.]